MPLSPGSLTMLERCDPLLRKLVETVAAHWPCQVVFGARTEAEELQAIQTGHSHLKDPRESKHVIWEGRPLAEAVDLVPLPLDWKDESRFRWFAGYVMATADQMGIPIRWGGSWRNDRLLNPPGMLQDLDHFERVT